MARFSVAGRAPDNDAAANDPSSALWNPHASIRLDLREVHLFQVDATASSHGLIRTSTRGTAGSTVTPDIDNNYSRGFAPISGALLDLANYSANPTVQPEYLMRANTPAAIGAGFIWVFGEPIQIPAGTGACIASAASTIIQTNDVSYIWDE